MDEQLREVLEYYKVVVTKDDIFSRCQVFFFLNNIKMRTFTVYCVMYQVCNSNFFIKLSRSTMNALAISQQTPKYAPPPPCYEMDEATGFSSEEECFEECTRPPVSYTRKWELCKFIHSGYSQSQ